MQLVASVFLWISPALVLTFIVNQSWFWEYAPGWLRDYSLSVPWASLIVGLLALFAAWYGGEHFILRQVRALIGAVRRLTSGDLQARTGLQEVEGELGELAGKFDGLAASLQQRERERDLAEHKLRNQAYQQTIIAALGQCALTNDDLDTLFNQSAILAGQMLAIEYAAIFQCQPDGRMKMLAGTGWKSHVIGSALTFDKTDSQPGFSADTGDVTVVADLAGDERFKPHPLLTEHGVVSGLTAAIPTREKPFGVLAVFSTHRREFSSEEIQFLLSAANTIGMAAERKRAEIAMKKLAAFVKENPNPMFELDAHGTVNYFNAAAQILALEVGRSFPQEILPVNYGEIAAACLQTGRSRKDLETRTGDRTFVWMMHPATGDNVVHCYGEEITDRLNLEEQLRQSQKMDSIGQLAAGVAHDFNNMLTIIHGHSSRLLADPKLPSNVKDSVLAVYATAERAAGLTRQLLMFTRKNVMQPRALDLRQVIVNMNNMLCRLLGETISLQFDPPLKLPNIYGDPGMIEQVLLNLAINAHDAMPAGGTLTVSVEEFGTGTNDYGRQPDAQSGRFVRLKVADTGCGMSAAVRAHIFEPFFTTKEVGKGTGLGLATVFGIVKQHSGWIDVASEPGRGTIFTVYFPVSDAPLPVEPEKSAAVVAGGSETILIVEDELVLREMAREFLADCGYRVLEAASGRQALEVWGKHRTEIDLLLTDMKMPEGISGLELAEKMLTEQPSLRVIFTSGYSNDIVSPEVLTRTQARFLPKPYTYTDLTRFVREYLDHKGIEGVPGRTSTGN